MVSGMCSIPYYEVVRIFQPGFQPWASVTQFLDSGLLRAFFNPGDKVACQLQEMYYTDTNTTYNKKSIDKQVTNYSACETFSYLTCDTRDINILWYNTLIIDHYPVVWESATYCGPNMYIFPFWEFLSILKARVWTEWPIMKDAEMYDRNLSPFWDDIGGSFLGT